MTSKACCYQNSVGNHCDCLPCGICEAAKVAAEIERKNMANLLLWCSAVIAMLLVAIALYFMQGCSCELQTHPTGQSGSTWKDTGIPLVGSAPDPARPFGRPAPRNDLDGGE